MLCNILLAVVCIGAFVTPFLCMYFFRWGVKYGTDKESAIAEPIIPKPKKKPQETEQMKRQRKLEKALENYNGDA